MVEALDRFFNVDELDNEAEYVDPKTQKVIPVHKLVISLKPERLEFAAKYRPYFTNAVMIHRAAGNIDLLFEQDDRVFGMGIDPVSHTLLVLIQRTTKRRQRYDEHGQD